MYFMCYTFSSSLTSIDFVNMPPTHSLDSLHKMVAENGGTFSMNLNNSVTHSIAAESKGLSLSCAHVHIFAEFQVFFHDERLRYISAGIKFHSAKIRGDIIHYSWLFDCCSHKKLLPLQTKSVFTLSPYYVI